MEDDTIGDEGGSKVIRAEAVSVGLFVLGYLIWCLGDTMLVQTAFSESSLRMGATRIGWQSEWPWICWGLGAAGLIFLIYRLFGQGIGDHDLVDKGGRLLVALGVIRLLSLIDAVGYVFPWMGVLWSPAAIWSASLFVVVWSILCSRLPAVSVSVRQVACATFVFFLLLYSAYGLYFVKTTSLHGDEPQYLLITQSLLEDGDIDLSNADRDRKLAFHEFNFNTHEAPASPEGRVHSTHPAGMPALLTVPYAIGEGLWSHPRLGAVLFQTVLFAAACGLGILVLSRFGFSIGTSFWTTFLTGLSVPLFTQANQLYPEIHAVLIAQIVLIAFPRWPVGSFRDRSSLSIALVCACIAILPFFHQRHLILAIVLVIPVLLAIREAGMQAVPSRIALGVFGLGVVLHLGYNLHYSGDLWGPYLPGNADTISADWGQSLFGQWIDVRQGLLRQAPVYLVAIGGLLALARLRDIRGGLVVALLAATAGVNTLSNDWTFGFCYPTRFMVAAYPALAIAFAFGLRHLKLSERPVALWMMLLGWWLGFESVWQGAVLPEIGFEGVHLVSRVSEAFYPSVVHFQDFVAGDTLHPGIAVFWCIVFACLYLAITHRRQRAIGLGIVALAPFVVSMTIPYEKNMDGSYAYQVLRYEDDPTEPYRLLVDLDLPLRSRGRGMHASSLPPLFRGKVEVAPQIEPMEQAQGVVGFHTLSLTSFEMRHGGSRHTVPLINSNDQAVHRFVTPGSAIAQQYVYSTGRSVEPGDTKWVLEAADVERETVFREELPEEGISMTLDNLKAGDYVLHLDRQGGSWSDFFSRETGMNVVAIFTGFDRVRTDADGLARMAERWLKEGWRDVNKPLPETYFPPQVEARVPYYWSLLPNALDQSGVSFKLDRDGPIHVVVIPDSRVAVDGIQIDRVTF